MIQTLLIANRGEVACRIARTATQLGIETVGVFAPPDRGAMHIGAMNRAVEIPDYLDGAAIIATADATGADAVHPGFGFLAENADFAEAVIEAGLTWVGPPPSAIRAMGSKAAARALMASAGVPVLPGYDGEAQDDATLIAEAERVGFPLMVKPSAGGGGKGMVVVESIGDLPAALAQARRLAAAAFGDERMVLERYLTVARHIEVQVMADSQGNTVHLFERECSVQRRHQKVIEEAPSPAFMGFESKRETLCTHAVQAAEAVNYVGAGTVEFIVDGEGTAYFLEMNTRLQVEHPVTEMVTGLDIVALQLEVAEGRPLPVGQSEIAVCGWAVEARLYAEDPARDFAPCTGAVGLWRVPNMEGIRVDTGVETGAEVGIHYDPMLAKIISNGPTRAVAIRRLQAALKQLVCLGLQTNRTYLQGVLSHPAFVAGTLHTRFLAEHADALSDDAPPVAEALAAAVVSDWAFAQSARRRLPGIAPNWRNNRWRDPRHSYRHQDVDHEVSWHQDRDTLLVGGRSVRVLSWDSPLHLEIDGIAQFCDVVSRSDGLWVQVGAHDVYLERVPDFIIPGLDVSAGGCVAPMPGKVVEVCVVVGDAVQKGDKLIVLEAMKMEQAIKAAEPGTVTAVHVDQGDQVELGAVLIELLGVSEES